MKIVIAFKSKKNTRKLAMAMGDALHTKPLELDGTAKVEDADLLFLGFGIYAGEVPKEVSDFVKTLNPEKIKKVVLFMTCGSGLDQSEKLKETIRNQGLTLEEKTFCCKGKMFVFANRNQPNSEDLQHAVKFAMSLN
ncbi:MAG: flavodoxin family protein [Mobilitalea sp.]